MKRRARSGITIVEVLVVIIAMIVLFVILAPMVGGPRQKAAALKTVCHSNAKRLNASLHLYMADYDEHLPRPSTWMIDSWDYVNRYGTYQCPIIRKENRGYGYAMNDKLAGRNLSKEPNAAKTPLVYESSNLKFNAHGPVTSLPKPGRHFGFNTISFLDGHTKAFKDGSFIP